MDAITLNPGSVTLAELRAIWNGAPIRLADSAWSALDAAAESVGRIVASGRTVYGVNTGFGLLAQTRIADDRLEELQRNLILSHSCGLGDALDRRIVRLIITLKTIGLARGHSGVRRLVVERLLAFLEADALPVIPAQGSVGASGDLAPLAHLSAALIGEGSIALGGEAMPAAEGLKRLVASALVAGALSLEALKGTDAAFDPRIHQVRGQPGQIAVATILRGLLGESEIKKSHSDCGKVQDPYSFRCQPQVMGASLDLVRHVARTLEIEANGVTDNPLIFPDTDEAVSGGNFHAQPVAFAADMLAMALCEVGSISERRTAVLVDPKMSGLPAFLVKESGLNSGFMIAQVTAAALVSENKTLAFPASVDSIPTSANQEDHVSMATAGARKAGTIARNAAGVIGIELLAAVQGIDFHAPLKTSARLQPAVDEVRAHVAHYASDRYFADDLAWAQAAVLDGRFADLAGPIF
jgi:histidine ammonia-lyase